MKPAPFSVFVDDAEIADLGARLGAARTAEGPGNEKWRYGANLGELREFATFWATTFEWRRAEQEINRFHHFTFDMAGLTLHFIHERGNGPRPLPLLMTHGWPWTFWDFAAMIGPLTDPAAYGGDPADAFDVVVPSLPGFAFSNLRQRTGVTAWETGDLLAHLMQEVLGYERFAAHGGDWGGVISSYLGHAYPEALHGIHLTGCYLVGPGYPSSRLDTASEDYGPEEQDYAATMAERMQTSRSHRAVADHDPESLALALNDSPLGLAAWLIERRRAWSDCGGQVYRSFSPDFLATTLSIYWHTKTIGTSMRLYRDSVPFEPKHHRSPLVGAPTAICSFPGDVVQLPRAFAARHANLQRWTRMPAGGHFGPAEQPELLVEDLRAFFRDFR